MGLGEFELIGRYFTDCGPTRADTRVGVGDDAAVLAPPAGAPLVMSTATAFPDATVDDAVEGALDATVDGVALATSLVTQCLDQLTPGASPRWLFMSLSVPDGEQPWLAAFAHELDVLCRHHELQLCGGDTTRGACCVEMHCLAVKEL